MRPSIVAAIDAIVLTALADLMPLSMTGEDRLLVRWLLFGFVAFLVVELLAQ